MIKTMNRSEVFRNFMKSYSQDDNRYICDPDLAEAFFEHYYITLGSMIKFEGGNWHKDVVIISHDTNPVVVATIDIEEDTEYNDHNHYHSKQMMAYVHVLHPILREHINSMTNRTMYDFFEDMNNLHPDDNINNIIGRSVIDLENRTITIQVDNHEHMKSDVYTYDIDDVAILFVKQLTDKLFSSM